MLFVILLALLSGLPLFAQSGLPARDAGQANDSFNAQRSYPNGIPDDAIGKAMAQRRALESTVQPSSSLKAASEAVVYQWAPLGPTVVIGPEGSASGRITCIAVDRRNPDFVYAGAAGGGIWLSKDAGKTWQSLGGDNLTSLVSGALALDPGTGLLYYGTGDYGARTYGAGIFRSPDSGTTWMSSNGWDVSRNKPQFSGGTTSRIAIDPSDSRIVYAARNSGLWRSTDGGDSWYRLVAGDASDFVIDPGNPSRLFVALGRSTGSAENGVYRSEDRGATWARMDALPSSVQAGRISLAISPSNSAVVFVLFSQASDQQALGLFRTSDSGKSWIGLPVPYNLFDSDGRGHGYFDNFIAVDPRDTNVLFLGGVELYKSSNGGLNWTLLSLAGNTRIIHEDQFSIAFKPDDPRTIYLGNDGGIYKSSDSGQTWQSLNQGLPVTQFNSIAVHPENSQLVFGGTQDQGLVRFSGNTAWDQLVRGDAGVVLFMPGDPKRMFVSKQRFKPLRSSDGGVTFESIAGNIATSDRVAFYPPMAISPVAGGTVFFGTHRVWTSPGSNTWSAASPDLTNGAYLSALAVSPVSGALFAGSFDGRLSFTLDLNTWQTGTGVPDRAVTSIAPDPGNGAVAYLTVSSFGSGHVFKTADGGLTWTDISGSLPDSPANSVAVDPRGVLYVATDVGVFRTEDSGLTWTSFNLGLPNAYVTSLALDMRSETLTAATYGRGAFQVRLKAPQSAGPGIVARGAVNAFSFSQTLAPGGLVSVFGTRLTVDSSQSTTAPYPLSLAGTSVTVNGIPAPLQFASPNQVNFQMPFNVTGSEALIRVSTAEGSTSLLAPLAPSAPGILSYGALHAATGARVDESNPAVAGEFLLVFGTGLGATNPEIATGAPAPFDVLARVVANTACDIGGKPANVPFAGLAPGFAGLYQVNIEVPPGVSGKTELTISTGGRISNAIVLYVR